MTIRTRPNGSESPQQQLFHDDLNSAIAGLVSALGGAKSVGSRLFPELSVDAAARRLLDALNSDRVQQLNHLQFMTLLKWGRQGGCNQLMEWLCVECGYTKPSAYTPEEERAELQRQYVEAVAQLQVLAKRLQK